MKKLHLLKSIALGIIATIVFTIVIMVVAAGSFLVIIYLGFIPGIFVVAILLLSPVLADYFYYTYGDA